VTNHFPLKEDLLFDAPEPSAPFRRLERRYTAVWGWVLLTDCVGRAVAAFLVPEAWLTWFGGAVTVAAIVVATIASGAAAVEGLTDLVAAAAAGSDRDG
jgi:hypothetical protein